MLSYFDSFCKGRKAERQPHLETLRTSPRAWRQRSPETYFRTEKAYGKKASFNQQVLSISHHRIANKAGHMDQLQLLIYS